MLRGYQRSRREEDAAILFLLVYSLVIRNFAIITFVAHTGRMVLATRALHICDLFSVRLSYMQGNSAMGRFTQIRS